LEYICPLCNGLKDIGEITCPKCGAQMEDKGALANYSGPYSPYEKQTLLGHENNHSNTCIHLFSCSNCDRDDRLPIPLMEI
jgi:hypothetical protein